MPTYEYKCSACDHAFERFHSMSAAPVKKCPECGKSKVKRLLGTGAGLIFKGSGFYITDYRSDAYQQAARSDAPAGSSDSKSEGSKTDAAADAKPAAGDKAKASSDAKPAAAAPKGESAAKSSSPKTSSAKSSTKKK
jgi:putative FmdB family regulatory protein